MDAWSHAVLKSNHRVTKDFVCAHVLGVDFDESDLTIAEALNVWADMQLIVGTTKSHQKEKNGSRPKDRFRVVFFFESPVVDPEAVKATQEHFVKHFSADGNAKDAVRYYRPCVEIVHVNNDGYFLDPEPAPKHSAKRAQKSAKLREKRYQPFGIVPPRTLAALSAPIPMGERNDTRFMIAKDLYDAGYSEDQIYELITNSPTYQHNQLTQDQFDDIWKSIRSGIKSVESGNAFRRPGEGR